MRISDWSSDVCSSDLIDVDHRLVRRLADVGHAREGHIDAADLALGGELEIFDVGVAEMRLVEMHVEAPMWTVGPGSSSSEEHTSELRSLMRNSYAGFRLKNKTHTQIKGHDHKP